MTKIFQYFQKTLFLAHFEQFSQFWGEKTFFRTTSYGFQASCRNLEKTNDTIPRKRLDRRIDRWKDGQEDGRTKG